MSATYSKKVGAGQQTKFNECSENPIWNIKQMNRIIGNAWASWLGIKGASSKGSPFTSKDGTQYVILWTTVWANNPNVSQHAIGRNLGFYHLQSILSSEDSDNLEKSQQISCKAKNHHWMLVTFDHPVMAITR